MSAHPQLARRMTGVAPSAVREILKVAERPEVISFAGGLPAPELFPVEAIARAHAEVFAREGAAALQYSVTEGFVPLREWIAARLGTRGMSSQVDSLLITSGSQQGIDLTARMLLDPGDVVLVQSPTYLAALQAFASYEARLVAVESDAEGMLPDALEAALGAHRVKLIYVVPEFQNPTGASMTAARREALVRLARASDVLILEDDPYGELRFSGQPSVPLASLAPERVLYLSTFSKTLAPGMRLGWMHGPRALIERATVAKQAADLHSGTLSQRAAAMLLRDFDFDRHLASLRTVYAQRRDVMSRALKGELPSGAAWLEPQGGLFFWLKLPAGVSDEALFRRAIELGVAVVPGSHFFVGAVERDFVRLNFSNQSCERIEEGMRRLGGAIREVLYGRNSQCQGSLGTVRTKP